MKLTPDDYELMKEMVLFVVVNKLRCSLSTAEVYYKNDGLTDTRFYFDLFHTIPSEPRVMFLRNLEYKLRDAHIVTGMRKITREIKEMENPVALSYDDLVSRVQQKGLD